MSNNETATDKTISSEQLADLWHAVRSIYINNGVDPNNFDEDIMPEEYVVEASLIRDLTVNLK